MNGEQIVERYEVFLTPTAQALAVAAAEYIAENSPRSAIKWYAGLERTIERLSVFPHRCAIAPESQLFGQELRHALYKSHRIIFRIEEPAKIVRVLYVRHGAMLPVGQAFET